MLIEELLLLLSRGRHVILRESWAFQLTSQLLRGGTLRERSATCDPRGDSFTNMIGEPLMALFQLCERRTNISQEPRPSGRHRFLSVCLRGDICFPPFACAGVLFLSVCRAGTFAFARLPAQGCFFCPSAAQGHLLSPVCRAGVFSVRPLVRRKIFSLAARLPAQGRLPLRPSVRAVVADFSPLL